MIERVEQVAAQMVEQGRERCLRIDGAAQRQYVDAMSDQTVAAIHGLSSAWNTDHYIVLTGEPMQQGRRRRPAESHISSRLALLPRA